MKIELDNDALDLVIASYLRSSAKTFIDINKKYGMEPDYKEGIKAFDWILRYFTVSDVPLPKKLQKELKKLKKPPSSTG